MTPQIDRQALIDSARHAYETARANCTRHCRDYHASWVYSRLLNVLPSVAHDHDFLLSAFGRMAERGIQRILISGAADFGMLSYLLAAYDRAGKSPQITVIDRCPSPLVINHWYAERRQIEITTVTTDIMDYEAEPFDLVTTHSFMNGFPPDRRAEVVGKWTSLLRPGGHFITANVIMENAIPDPATGQVRRFDDAGIQSLVDRYLKAHQAEPDAASIDSRALEELVRDFAANRVVYPVTSVQALTQPFVDEGYKITHLDEGPKSEPGRDGSHRRFRTRLIADRP